MITTIAFDLDDTLYDEFDYCKSGFTAVADFLSARAEPLTSADIFNCLWAQFTGGDRKTTFNTALDKLAIAYDDKLIGELITTYRNHEPKITLPADAATLLDQLRGYYKMALLTDGFLPAQQLKVRALHIEEYFDCIVYTEQLGREFWKPSPVGFEKIMDQLDVPAEQIVYVADNERKDFIAPNRLGFMTVRIIRPAGIHEFTSPQPDAKADYVINELTELPDLFG